MLNPARLALMKPTAYLINVARGPIVDEEALIAALREERIAGAGLDVFEQEPPDPANRSLRNGQRHIHRSQPLLDRFFRRRRRPGCDHRDHQRGPGPPARFRRQLRGDDPSTRSSVEQRGVIGSRRRQTGRVGLAQAPATKRPALRGGSRISHPLRDCLQRKTQIKYFRETRLWGVRNRCMRRHAATQFHVPATNASRIDDRNPWAFPYRTGGTIQARGHQSIFGIESA